MYKIKSHRHIRIITAGILILLPVIFAACYYDYGMSVKDYDIVATFYNHSYNFTGKKTFSIVPKVGHIVEGGEIDTTQKIYDDLVIEQVRVNMEVMGYTEIKDPTVTQPDYVVMCLATQITNYVAYQSYPWYGGWGGYYGGYWGYYPWYPVSTVYSYSVGTVLINLLDPSLADNTDKKIPVEWVAGINGLLDDTSVNIRQRLSSSISQAFKQSPYLEVTVE
jgi:hypothetical protein